MSNLLNDFKNQDVMGKKITSSQDFSVGRHVLFCKLFEPNSLNLFCD
jgi:hypothetical protein